MTFIMTVTSAASSKHRGLPLQIPGLKYSRDWTSCILQQAMMLLKEIILTIHLGKNVILN